MTFSKNYKIYREEAEDEREEQDVLSCRGKRLGSKLSNSAALFRPALQKTREEKEPREAEKEGVGGRRRGEAAKGWAAGAKLDEHSV